MNRVLLAGATGYLGGFILKELLQQGFEVKALVRNLKKIVLNNQASLKLCEVEVTNPESIVGCCDDVEVVISTIGITKQKDGLSYMDVDFQANLNLLQEAQRAGVSQFIYVSALNAEKLQHLSICKAKELFVEKLKASGLRFCIIRPNGFFSDMTEFLTMAQKGRVYLFAKGQFKTNPIHGADLAKVCVGAIESQDQEIEVGGPEIFTHEQIARIAFTSVKKTPKIIYIPEWLRVIVIRLLQSLTKPTFHGPVEFFMTVMAMDMVAPKYGNKTLKAFFDELNLEEKGKVTH